MEKNIKVTNKKQFEEMVSFMEQNDAIARGKGQFGMTKQTMEKLWQELTDMLNSYGPPTRTSGEWQRVCTHYKVNLKRKLTHNKKNLSTTGGGPSNEISLNSTEERVSQLIHMEQSVNPSGRVFGIETLPQNVVTETICFENTPDSQITITSHSDDVICLETSIASHQYQTTNCSNTVPKREPSVTPLLSTRKRQLVSDSRLQILQEQAQTQKDVLKTLKSIENAQLEKVHIKKRKLELYEQTAKLKKQFYQLKIKIAKAKLEEMENIDTETIYLDTEILRD